MSIKKLIKSNKIDINYIPFQLALPSEICRELSSRLRRQRLLKNIRQQELAKRSGLSVGTIKNIETKAQVSLENFIRILCALGLAGDLENLFKIEAQSIADLEKIEKMKNKKIRKRAR